MDQYIKVTFPTRRQVWVDGTPVALTNRVFQVETGNHTITLNPRKKNFTPEQYTATVVGTMPTEPMHFEFERQETTS